ncbi:MAG: hypothetical protein KJO18_09590 [Acidimicrobiia bacterium]|nr:hypothetical protein [Acidimicrobiia bacterium]
MVDDIKDAFSEVVTDIIGVIPAVVAALVFLIAGLIISPIIRNLFHKLLKAVSFDKGVDKSGLGGFVERAGYPDSALLVAKIVGWMVMLIFVKLSVAALGVDSIEDLVDRLVAWIPNVIIAIILVVITGAAANFVKGILTPALQNTPAGDLIGKIIVAAIWVIGGMMAIDQLGFGEDIVDQLWTALTTALAGILLIKFGVGGIWAARDRFWPKVYDTFESDSTSA